MTAADQCWSMDFVADNLFNGRRIRSLTVVDNFSRECLAIEVGQGLRGDDVVTVMARLKQLQHRGNGFRPTTAANLSQRRWINGHMKTG